MTQIIEYNASSSQTKRSILDRSFDAADQSCFWQTLSNGFSMTAGPISTAILAVSSLLEVYKCSFKMKNKTQLKVPSKDQSYSSISISFLKLVVFNLCVVLESITTEFYLQNLFLKQELSNTKILILLKSSLCNSRLFLIT